MEVVDGTSEGRDIVEDVVEGGGQFTTDVNTLEEGEIEVECGAEIVRGR